MTTVLVTWEMHVETESGSPREAAQAAWEAMRRADSSACVFKVIDESGNIAQIDLMETENPFHPESPEGREWESNNA